MTISCFVQQYFCWLSMMKLFISFVLLIFLFTIESEGLQCYTCAGASNEECNQQGSEQCPGHSDACAIIRGQSSGIMKSCSYRSFCDRARRGGSQTPGVSVYCCYSNNCNAKGLGSRNIVSMGYFHLFVFSVFWHLLFNLN